MINKQFKTNTLFTGDNLDILTGIDSDSIDLIYTDPPYNSKRMYSAPVGSTSAGASFKDMWTWNDVDEARLESLFDSHPVIANYIQSIAQAHGRPMMAYITYMTQRLVEIHRILKDTGSFYLHIDPTASHYLKVVLDIIFGKNNYRNEVIWEYGLGGSSKRMYSKKHDVILFYTKSDNYYFDKPLIEATSAMMKGKMKGMKDVWQIASLNNMAKERTGYPTQKPLALMDRIVQASSREGDIVLDPFCGCATTCVSADRLNRKWIGIDISENAVGVVTDRLRETQGENPDMVHLTDVPRRMDVTYEEPTGSHVKPFLIKRDGCKCNGCKKDFDKYNLEIDHVIPKSKGGVNYVENYQLLCSGCNKKKGDRPMEYLMDKLRARDRESAKFNFSSQ